ncbi:MAG TPA: 3-hydroxyacyl-CoA dehydrogenase NAD-binding domain-containing protein [Candidatus Lustribacter sp.]|nr:3-hydroxyacyl-CoA dehydrogenase NAD-binding domain-containing protein [Candidatus Lustribacter sp.]
MNVRTEDRAGVRIVTLDNPPVNAISFAYAAQLVPALAAAEADASVHAVVLTGANGLFSGGADISDFTVHPEPGAQTIRDVIAAVERSAKTYVAALEKTALGGGAELALACDYRIAVAGTQLGFPEIKLGLIPGAGGTQRLPRLIGAQDALQLMLKGDNLGAEDALKKGLLDEVVASDAVGAALALVDRVRASAPKRRISERRTELGIVGLGLFALPFVVAQAHKLVPPEERGGLAAHKLIDAVEASIELDFPRGLAREYRLFGELAASAPSAALRHVFFAERELGKIPGLPPAESLPIRSAGIVGGGTMGTGIAIAFANAGLPVVVVEPNDDQIERAKQMVFGMFAHQVQRGRLTQEEAWQRGRSIRFESDYAELAAADVVIEAVFENMDVKKGVFAQLDAICKPSAILASNTSTLDIDALAAQTKRPTHVCGLHFFVPANIMKLLEIVRARDTSPQTLATAIALAKTLRKVGVPSGNAFGFIGNRMLFDYAREAIGLAEEGIAPERIDRAMKDFGMAMGPFAMFDLSGLDVFWRIEQGNPEVRSRSAIVDRLYREGRFGQKSGAGIYRYEKGSREPVPDPVAVELIREEAAKAGIVPRTVVSDAEIVQRLVGALVAAGEELLRAGVALRPGDIDIVYVYGYGFPPYRGGPMWYGAKELAHA